MTTSGPQTDPDDREHRSIGQRIRDAVLGDPAETRDGDDAYDDDRGAERAGDRGGAAGPDAGYADRGAGPDDRSDTRGGVAADPRSDSAEQGGTYDEPGRRTDAGYGGSGRESTDLGYADPEEGAGIGAPGYVEGGRNATAGAEGYVSARDDDEPGTGYADSGDDTNAVHAEAQRSEVRSDAGYADRSGAAGYDDASVGSTRPGAEYAETGRDEGRGDPAYGDPGRADPGYIDTRSDRGYAEQDRPVADAGYTDPNRPAADAGYAEPQRGYDQGGAVPDPVRDDVRQDRGAYADDAGYVDTGRGAAPDDRDLVTSSYDPARDSYDPQAAGTAMTDPGDTRSGAVGEHDTRDYDPATDTGYVDEGRGGAERATGRDDADYDTGRVDAGSADRDTGRAGGLGTAGAIAAGGAAAAAGVVAAHHRRSDDPDGGRFSDVDDTSTVDPTSTGRATSDVRTGDLDDDAPLSGVTGDAPVVGSSTADTRVGDATGDAAAGRRAEAVSDETDEDASGRERLVPADRAHDYSSRWDALKGDFVDEPRRAVAQADDLVGEVLDDIQRLFSDQRRELEQGFDHDRASTEDLRLALRRYRSFFDRLLSL